jgi:uncharacterized membrane protein
LETMMALPPPFFRPRRHGLDTRPLHAQRGAIGLAGVMTLLMLLTFTALSVDTGRLWLERKGIQRAADMAALAASRFTGCGSSLEDVRRAARETAAANGIDPGTVTVEVGVMSRDAKLISVFTPAPIGTSNGVRVSLNKTVAQSVLLGGYNNRTVTIPAVATAQGGPPIATYSVGSVYGISAQGAQQISNVFKGVLGNGAPSLDTAGINELVTSTVTLGALQQAAGAATINDLLNQQMTIRQFLDLIARASPDASSLDAFQKLYTASAGNSTLFLVSQILNIQSPAPSGVSSAEVSVFDLINASIYAGAINQGGVINMSLGLNFLGKTTLSILNPPIIAIGSAGKSANGNWCSQAQSAQMSLRSTLAPFKFPGGLDLSIVDIALRVDTLVTKGHLEALSVAPGQINGSLSSQSTIVTVVLTNSNDVDKPIDNLSGYGIGYIGPKLLNTGFKIYLPVGQSKAEEVDFSYTSKADLPSTKILGAGGLGDTIGGLIGKDTYIEARVLGLKVPLSSLGNIFGLVTQPLGNAIDGLLEGMGIKTGSVKMQVIDVSTSQPQLRQ